MKRALPMTTLIQQMRRVLHRGEAATSTTPPPRHRGSRPRRRGVVLILMLLSAMVSILVLRQPSEGCVVADSSGFSQIVHACFGERPPPLRPFEHLANLRLKEAREDHNDGLSI